MQAAERFGRTCTSDVPKKNCRAADDATRQFWVLDRAVGSNQAGNSSFTSLINAPSFTGLVRYALAPWRMPQTRSVS